MSHPLRAVLTAVLVASLAAPRAGLAQAPAAAPPALPRVAVAVVPLDARARALVGALEQSAEVAAQRSGRFTLVPGHDAFDPAAARTRQAALASARARVAEGKQALDELDNVKATEAFVAALAAYAQADATQASDERLDAWVLKAASHATGGETAAARKDLEAVLALRPRSEVSSALFPPDLIRYAETQRRQRALARAELLVRTTPAGARVWVDGMYQGLSPVTVAGLAQGRHVVDASLGGFRLAQQDVAAGEAQLTLQPAELAAAHQRAVAQASGDPEGAGRGQAAQQLARALGVDQVVLVLARKSLTGEQLDLVALRVEGRDGHHAGLRSATVDPLRPDLLAAFLDPVFATDAPRDGQRPVTPGSKVATGLPPRTIVAVGLLGLGAAAAISGGVFGILASERSRAFQDTPQVQVATSQQLRSQGQTFAVVADISWLVGIASAATGGVLLLTGLPPAAPSAAAAPEPTPAKQPAAAPARPADSEARPPPPASRGGEADRSRAGDEKRKKEEAERARLEEEKRKKDDADRARLGEDRRKKDEAERARLEEDKRKKDEAERARVEDEKRRKDEAERVRLGDDRRKKEEAEPARLEEEKRKKDEAERARLEEEKRKKEEAERARLEEEKRKKEGADGARLEEEKRKKDEAERLRLEEEKRKKEEAERLRLEEEKRKKEEAERLRLEDEKRKKEEEERKKRKEEDHDDLRNY